MSSRWLYDTSIYIEVLRDPEFAGAFRARYLRDIPHTHMCSVVVAELTAGAITPTHQKQAAALYQPFERAGRIVVASHAVWKQAGASRHRTGDVLDARIIEPDRSQPTATIALLGGAFTRLLHSASELLHRQSDIPRDLAEEARRDVATLVEWDGRTAPVSVPILAVGSPPTHLDKSQSSQERGHFASF